MGKFCGICGQELQDGEMCPICHPEQAVISEVSEVNEIPVTPTKPRGIKGFFWCWKGENYKALNKKQKLGFMGIIIALIVCVGAVPGLIIAVGNLANSEDTLPVITHSSSSNPTSQSETYKDIVEPSDNSFGMRFNMTLEQYVESYNNKLRQIEDNEATIKLMTLDVDKFECPTEQDFDPESPDITLKRYGYTYKEFPSGTTRFMITLDIEEETSKIAMAQFLYSIPYFNSLTTVGQQSMLGRDLTCAFAALDISDTMDKVNDNISKMLNSSPAVINERGVVYSADEDTYNNQIFFLYAMTEPEFNKRLEQLK